MASDASRSGAPSTDSYIGSLISLTSKYEIRYEGVLYNINTEESSIGLRNVRSFGTEGRKKDGQQIPPSDKIYEYILFRGSDIKDLQVKASPPVQVSPIHNDPAIIQSHYARPTSTPTNLPNVGTGTAVELNSHTAQVGPQRPTFQGDLSLGQPGGNLGSWGSLPLPPAQNGSGLAVPFYWQGYYTPPGGLPHLQQPSLFRPPPGVPIPHAMQQSLQYPGTSASVPSGTPKIPEFPALLFQPGGSTLNLTSTTLPSTLAPSQISSSIPDTTSVLSYKPPISSFHAPVLSANISPVPPLDSSLKAGATMSSNLPSFGSSKPSTVPLATMVYQTMPQSMPMPPIVRSSIPGQHETLLPLVTPGQLLQPDVPTISTSQPPQTSVKHVEVKPPDAKIKSPLSESSIPAASDTKGPILPLPTVIDQKPNTTILQTHLSSRGRARGRGNAYPRPVTKSTEDFDFMAMNEKFKKDEVWGDLGKNKGHLNDKEGDENGADYILENEKTDSSNLEVKPIYVKEDFFDSLSSNAIAHGARNGRTRFSEQSKLDTETFGEFQRHRQGRGGGRGFRGGRTHGSYYGRGYGYTGRGRGHNTGSPAN